MKLYAPEFERALKRGVRQAVRSDAGLRKEYRRTKGPPRPRWLGWLTRLVFSFFLGASVATVMRLTQHPETALAFVTLWMLAAAAFLSSLLAPVRLQGPDVRALQLLPVSDFTIFLFRRDKTLITHVPVYIDLLAGLGVLAFRLQLPGVSWIGIVAIAGLAWVFSVTLAMFAGARFPQFRTGWLSLGLAMLFVAWFVGNKIYGPQMIAALDYTAPALNLMLPTGWPLEFFHWVTGAAWWTPLVGLLPMAYVMWSYRACERVVGERFVYEEPHVAAELPEQVPTALVEAGAQAGRPIGVTTISEGILSRACLELPRWDEDWAQRMLWRWLTPREQALANFIFPNPVAMVRPWTRIVRHLLAGVVAWQMARFLFPPYENVALMFALGIPLVEALGQSWPAGAAFRTVRIIALRISLLAPYPVSFGEVSNLLLKCALFQLPMLAAIVTGLAVLYAVSHGLPWLGGLLVGLRITVGLIALRLALLTLNFASMSNDTSRSWLRIIVALAIAVVEICVFVALGAGTLMIPSEPLAWLCGLVFVGTQYGFLRFYGWMWNRGTIDLMVLDAR